MWLVFVIGKDMYFGRLMQIGVHKCSNHSMGDAVSARLKMSEIMFL